MTGEPPDRAQTDTTDTTDTAGRGRRRNAAQTRQLLLEVARRRFARDGYSATTLRDITDEAGVNVALVSRYFSSKEGLFESCLASAVDDWGSAAGQAEESPDIATVVAGRLAGPRSAEHTHKMVLLLRSSGDGRAEEIRLGILQSFAQRLRDMNHARGRTPLPDVNAQVALAALLGVALLRSSTAMQPLAGAGVDDLVKPLRALLQALLT